MSTRGEMIANILSDTNREDKLSFMSSWFRAAEARINLALRDERMVKHAINPLEDYVFPLPPDFVAHKTISLRKGVEGVTQPGERAGTLRYFPSDTLDAGTVELPYPGNKPSWFTTRGRQIEIGTWNAPLQLGVNGYQIDMWYYAELVPLVEDGDTNWFSEKYPHVYEDMVKYFAYRNLQEYDTADKHLVMATTEIGILNEASKAMQHGEGPLIQRPARRMGGRKS